MLFNSIEFGIFLPIVFLLYWFVFKNNLRYQNLLLLVASYVFYGWWDWRFLSLIFFSSIVDYSIGQALKTYDKTSTRKLLLTLSIVVNIGFLGFFKYYNFFVQSFVEAFTLLGNPIQADTLKIILPVGISFYTFQTLSYSIDVYRRKLQPTKDFVAFFTFVSFFPQLVAGPIERATNLLPQFYKKRQFNYSQTLDGTRQILWGLFKKVVIADNCAMYANNIFENYTEYSGGMLFLGAVFFAFQIYGDFSGYSDIAIGTSRLFGFNLMQNFAFPYFSRDIAEFWRRWHISLSTWFRDYVYIPLGGSQGSKWFQIRNVFIIFLVSGFWHGANWTFIMWGLINACYFLPLMLLGRNRKNVEVVSEGRIFPGLLTVGKIMLTFSLTVLAWVFFRADTVQQAFFIIGRIFTTFIDINFYELKSVAIGTTTIWHMALLGVFIIIEWFQRDKSHALELTHVAIPSLARWGLYYFIVASIFYFGGGQQEFIYFQF